MSEDRARQLADELQRTNFLLNQKIVQMETLYETGLSLSSSLRADEVVGQLLPRAVAVVDARSGFLYFRDQPTERYYLADHTNMSSEQVDLLEKGALRQRMRRITSGRGPLSLVSGQLPAGFHGQHVLLAPVGAIGFLGVVDRETRDSVLPFTDGDARLLELIGQQAGLALANADLYRRMVDERSISQNIFNSVANGVISTDLEGLIVRANPPAKRIFSDFEILFGRSCVRLLQKCGCCGIAAAIASCLDDGEPRSVEGEQVAGGLTLNARINPLRTEEDEVEGLVITLEDLTEQTRMRSMFKQYASDQVVDLLLERDLAPALGGEIREATMLFVDVVGFTELLGKLGGEEVVRLMNDCYTHLVDIVFEHSGTLDKYTGDGFLAVFGAPLSSGDDSRRAVQTSLDILAAIQSFNRSTGQNLGIGIGIASARVVAGNIGSPRRMEYSVIGPDVNLAARLCDRARADQILVSAAVRDEVSELFAFEDAGRHVFKHLREPVRVYAVLGPPGTRPAEPVHPRLAAESTRIDLNVPMLPNMEVTVSQTAHAIAEFMGMDRQRADEVKLALIEACINSFEHSQSKDGRLQIDFVVGETDLTIIITDRGHGFDPEKALRRARQRRERGEMRRGWGLELIDQFMDGVDVESDREGTTLTLTKFR